MSKHYPTLFFFFLHRFSEGLEVLFTLAVKIDQDVTKGNILMWQMALICLWCIGFLRLLDHFDHKPNASGHVHLFMPSFSITGGLSGLLRFHCYVMWQTHYRDTAILINLSRCITVTKPRMPRPLGEAHILFFTSILLTWNKNKTTKINK